MRIGVRIQAAAPIPWPPTGAHAQLHATIRLLAYATIPCRPAGLQQWTLRAVKARFRIFLCKKTLVDWFGQIRAAHFAAVSTRRPAVVHNSGLMSQTIRRCFRTNGPVQSELTATCTRTRKQLGKRRGMQPQRASSTETKRSIGDRALNAHGRSGNGVVAPALRPPHIVRRAICFVMRSMKNGRSNTTSLRKPSARLGGQSSPYACVDLRRPTKGGWKSSNYETSRAG